MIDHMLLFPSLDVDLLRGNISVLARRRIRYVIIHCLQTPLAICIVLILYFEKETSARRKPSEDGEHAKPGEARLPV